MNSSLLRVTSQITALARSGSISCARKVFDEMPDRDTVAFNAMVSGYVHMGHHQEALSLFSSMRLSGNMPDEFTFTAALSACAGAKKLCLGKKIHGLVLTSGHASLFPVGNALIDMYGKCGRDEQAESVFRGMGLRNEVSWCSLLFAYANVGLFDAALLVLYDMPRRVVEAWNTIIAGCMRWGKAKQSFGLFKEMLEDCCRPNQWTFSAVMNACNELTEPCPGFVTQGLIVRSGWGSAVEVTNSVLSFYMRFGEETDVLKAVGDVRVFNEVSWNIIIDAYMRLGYVTKACRAFENAPQKNLISWTSMVAGFMRNGLAECAVRSFVDMMKKAFHPDDVAFGAVLHACSNLATLGHSQMVHGFVIRSGFHAYPYVGNGLVNVYAKCGDIFDAQKAFGDIRKKDLASWNTMLFAFGLHGFSSQALGVLEEMVASGIKPDKVTFIGLLMTCSHLGLINEGLLLFESMRSQYGLCPEIDHVYCMVDMLGRGGKLEKAKELANKYIGASNLNTSSLEALFGSYSSQGDLSAGATELGKQLQILKPGDEMSYVLLSNLYYSSGQWEEAHTLRRAIAEQEVKKQPSCSRIEVRNQVSTFVDGKYKFLFMEQIHMVLHHLKSETRYPSSVLFCPGMA